MTLICGGAIVEPGEACCNVVLNGSGDPSTNGTNVGIPGDLYLNNDDGCWYVSDGSAWTKMFPGVITNVQWNDATNAIDITFANGTVVPVTIQDDIANWLYTWTVQDDAGNTYTYTNASGPALYSSPNGSINITVNPATGEVAFEALCCPTNVIVPATAFADPDNPTSAEVQTWLLANGYTADNTVYAHVAGASTDPNDPDYSYFFDGSNTYNTNEPGCCPKNVEVPIAAFADPNNPTSIEIETWLLANGYSAGDVVYAYYTGNGTAADPDYTFFFDGTSAMNTESPLRVDNVENCIADTDNVITEVNGVISKTPYSEFKLKVAENVIPPSVCNFTYLDGTQDGSGTSVPNVGSAPIVDMGAHTVITETFDCDTVVAGTFSFDFNYSGFSQDNYNPWATFPLGNDDSEEAVIGLEFFLYVDNVQVKQIGQSTQVPDVYLTFPFSTPMTAGTHKIEIRVRVGRVAGTIPASWLGYRFATCQSDTVIWWQ